MLNMPEAEHSVNVRVLAELVDSRSVFVLDLRRSTHGEQIYGALRYDPKKLLDAPKLALPLPQSETAVVLYDEDGTSKTLTTLRDKLEANGYSTAVILEGGFDAWKAVDGKTEGETIEQAVPLISTHQAER